MLEVVEDWLDNGIVDDNFFGMEDDKGVREGDIEGIKERVVYINDVLEVVG